MSQRRFFNPPRVILSIGAAGVGKTTYLSELARHIYGVYIEKDVVQDQFTKERAGDYYKGIAKQSYMGLFALAESNLKLGQTVIFDAPFVIQAQQPEWYDFINGIADRSEALLRFIKFTCSRADWEQRLKARNAERDQRFLGDLEGVLQKEPLDVAVQADHLVVNTSLVSPKDAVKLILDYL